MIGNIADESHSIGSYIVAFSIVNPKIKISSKKFGPYLTSVDDGPNPEYTGMLLDGLKERGVKATFFVLGAEVELYSQLVRRACEEGHLIGVHAYRHVNLRQLSDGLYFCDCGGTAD